MHKQDMRVPLLDLKRQYGPLKSQILAAIEAVTDSQHLVLGPEVEKLETAIAAYTGAGHAIGVSSGTDAQLVLLMALGIGPGDVVVTSPYTFFATAGCIERVGARVVFADIDPFTYNLSVEDLGRALAENDRVKAVIPIHLFGCCADMEPIIALADRYGVPVWRMPPRPWERAIPSGLRAPLRTPVGTPFTRPKIWAPSATPAW